MTRRRKPISAPKATRHCWRRYFPCRAPCAGMRRKICAASPATPSRNASCTPHRTHGSNCMSRRTSCRKRPPNIAPKTAAAGQAAGSRRIYRSGQITLRDELWRDWSSASGNCRSRGIIDMLRLFRLWKIIFVVLRFGLDEFILAPEQVRWLRAPLNLLLFLRDTSAPRAVRLRHALERLGPIFVKFGQMLSTRRDLIPTDIAEELAKLQDRVPPFPGADVLRRLREVYGKPIEEIYARFEIEPVASASVAQVHLAQLPDGTEVAVKVLRPGISSIIAKDVALLDAGALLLELLWSDGKRLKPREVVAEFARHLDDELDLMREAANANQLRRNFLNSPLLAVPEVHWDYCSTQVMVMERMHGLPVSAVDQLRAQGVDIPKLARAGVEIFFTQVFRDGFFHADMHPGNILVAPDGQYVALDFGIMGTLTDSDKLTSHGISTPSAATVSLSRRRSRISNRAGRLREPALMNWNRPSARCEPIFDKPLQEISFGKVLLQGNLFLTSRRFNIEIRRNWCCCCKKRCSTSKGWACSTRNWIYGKPPSRGWNAG